MPQLALDLVVRDTEFEDLPALGFSGGGEHLTAVGEAIGLRLAGDAEQVVVQLPNGAFVANGAVDYRKRDAGAPFGELWMLSVHEAWQSLGVGTLMIAALEQRIGARGLTRARIGVEHDNPRALRLYQRLGYRECGTSLDHWSEGGGRSHVTVCMVLDKVLAPSATSLGTCPRPCSPPSSPP